MNRIIPFFICLLIYNAAVAQTPVPMASQPGLTYTEGFSDIANWTNNFAAGIGANRWAAVAVNASGTIPDGVKTTVSTATFQTTSSSGGVQRGGLAGSNNPAGTIVLLSTGSTVNTSACAIDVFLNFTGVDAGTLSFDWTQVNNSTGDRAASVRVYASIDGTTFSEITTAAVNNVINNNTVNTSGSITTVALPTSFNGVSTARLRFYYFNGTTNGTTGSRPKISIDNLTVTAVANTPCTTPTAQPTALNFGTITSTGIAGSFTAASPAPNGYLTVISNNNSLTSLPVDSTNYNLADNIGDGYVIANGNTLTFSATGLSPSTIYYFYIFSKNNVCSGGTKYLTVNPLTGNATTIAGLPACTAPPAQPTNLTFGTTTVSSIQGSFTAATADGYLVLRSTFSTLSANPVNAAAYNTGDAIGNAFVVQQSSLTNFTATGLATNTLYYFYVFSFNNLNCSNGPAYYTVAPLSSSWSTANLSACTTPTGQPSNITFTIASRSIAGTFNTGTGNDIYLVIRSLNPSLSSTPIDNTDYLVGDNLGGGIVISNNGDKSFITNGLTTNTTYYFYVFAANKFCSGGTKYLTVNPLTGNATTTNDAAYNYYFGNLHSHSDYSDGNQDNPGYTPSQDYTYAMASQCMDYLGISEHNHFSSVNSPGNTIGNYHLGVTQANNFMAANPGFIALYGMEWGVISNGGHVLIYGDGMDNLWGWETGSGVWGPTNNYDVLVAKSDYTGANGLFKTVNDNSSSNTFASLAHPNSTDFGNISNLAYNSVADAAISGTAVESGPAFSTNTTYSDPGSSLSYLSYYQTLLAKGYHLGPSIDHDNHNTTFGRTTYSRAAIVAPAKTKTEIIKGFRNMHFYATQDCDTKVDFTLNTKIMGSIHVGIGVPVISVNISDATTSTAGAIIRVMKGTPGSAINAVKIDSAIGSTLTFVDNNLANNAIGYYYIDITNGTKRIVTAPVWYTRVDGVVAVTFSSFTIQKVNNVAKLTWTTEQEINSSHFIIERSADGRNWKTLATVAAAGYSNNHLDYYAYDNLPLNGTGYYRIKQVDKDDKFQVSVVRNIRFDLDYMISISPNPASDFINISFDKTNSTNSLIRIFDASGNLVFTEKNSQPVLHINTSKFGRGLYFIKVTNAGHATMQKLILQ